MNVQKYQAISNLSQTSMKNKEFKQPGEGHVGQRIGLRNTCKWK